MPTVIFEFVVPGPPYSANNDTAKPKTDWKQAVGIAAYKQWIADGRAETVLPVMAELEAYVTTYCGSNLYDVDNVLKWTLDGLSEDQPPTLTNNAQRQLSGTYKSIYKSDNQIYKVTSERVAFDTWTELAANEVSELVYQAIDRYSQPNSSGEFMHIRLTWEESED